MRKRRIGVAIRSPKLARHLRGRFANGFLGSIMLAETAEHGLPVEPGYGHGLIIHFY